VSRGTPTAEVTLGEHTVPVYAQRHAYLANRLGKFVDSLSERTDRFGDADNFFVVLQDFSYELLCMVIPTLAKRMPEYEFRGFSSREAMEAGDYDEQADKSPTVPEIKQAFAVAARVNGFDALGQLRGLVDPKLARAWVTAQLADLASQTSQTSPSANGASVSTSSGTTPPTSTPSED
jgi:hypothetical protein